MFALIITVARRSRRVALIVALLCSASISLSHEAVAEAHHVDHAVAAKHGAAVEAAHARHDRAVVSPDHEGTSDDGEQREQHASLHGQVMPTASSDSLSPPPVRAIWFAIVGVRQPVSTVYGLIRPPRG